MTKDLTQGSPVRLILGFALPLLAGMLFQQLYNLVDTLIVGRFLGMEALAGVGATGSINFLVLGFCMGICSGFAIPVAQSVAIGDGANDLPMLKLAGLGVAHELGLAVPGDVSIIAWDDSVLCEHTYPSLTALSHDVLAFGSHAARRLTELISGGTPAHYLDSAPTLAVRSSTGPVAVQTAPHH